MQTTFFEVSAATGGRASAISEARFDSLVARRREFDLFVAVKGDQVFARGAEAEAARADGRSPRLFRSNVVPLINLARVDHWLTASQAGTMTSPTTIPPQVGAPARAVTHRKALERGRRAVDVCMDKVGRQGRWRFFETGVAAPSGERTYRFRRPPRRGDGTPLKYCFAWMEAVPSSVDFYPSAVEAVDLPLHDGSFPLVQARGEGLKVTVRDAVFNGVTSELVILVDLLNELDVGAEAVVVNGASFYIGEHGWRANSRLPGARIRALGHDVQRLPTFVVGGSIAVVQPQSALHFGCLAFQLAAWEGMKPRVISTVALSLDVGSSPGLTIDLPFRVVGSPLGGRLVEEEGGWAWRPG